MHTWVDGSSGNSAGVTVRVALAFLLCVPLAAIAQVTGEKAEMDRLQAKAEDAIANDDPEGAAMAMGRAALMAAQLAKTQAGSSAEAYRIQEALFRSQEQTYRAMALFRRAGGQLPASSGVCGNLALAHGGLHRALDLMATAPSRSADPAEAETRRLREAADNWNTVIDSMIAEYQCP
jgi:hypothetical protein